MSATITLCYKLISFLYLFLLFYYSLFDSWWSVTVSEIITLLVNRIWRHAEMSARGQFVYFLITNTERLTPTLYYCSMVTFRLSPTVLKLFHFLVLAGKCLSRVLLWGFLGVNTPKISELFIQFTKRHFLSAIRVVQAINHQNRFRRLTCGGVQEYLCMHACMHACRDT
jgi:hypothetical protein